MDLFGVGLLEVIVILVVALVVLGPERTIGVAKSAGKMMGQMRRAMGDLSRAVEEEERDLDRRLRGGGGVDIEGIPPPEDPR